MGNPIRPLNLNRVYGLSKTYPNKLVTFCLPVRRLWYSSPLSTSSACPTGIDVCNRQVIFIAAHYGFIINVHPVYGIRSRQIPPCFIYIYVFTLMLLSGKER